MFLGHFAVGFASKSLAPRVSLGTLFLAAQLIDLIWPTLLLLGIERVQIEPGITRVTPLDFEHYPISHSLVAVAGWAAAFALVYCGLRRNTRGVLVIGALVVSHWLLDAIVHRPDLPLYPGGAVLVGLGVWASLPGTLILELGLLALGTWLYLRATSAIDAVGKWSFWALVAFLCAIYLANVFGEPPPDVTALAWVGQAQWLLVLWGYWIDRHRSARGAHEGA
jgi:hypothetical protein